MTTITKQNLAVLEAAKKDGDYCYQLDHVMIKDGKIWASNAKCLYSSELEEREYPDFDVNGVDYKECMLIPAASLKKAETNIPKVGLLKCIQVLVDDEYKHLVTSDLQTTQDLKIKHPDNTDWPSIELVLSLIKEPKLTINLSLENLEVLVKVLKKHGEERVTLDFTDGQSPVVAIARGLKGYLMPMV
jgi:hypothetical protein